MRRIKKGAIAAALAALTATSLLPPAADAVIGQVRATGDYRLTPTANNNPSRGKAGPNLAVNPADPNHIVTLIQELETEECEVSVSRDGGTTWGNAQELQAPTTGTPAYPVNLPGPCDVTGHGAANIGQHSVKFGSGNNVYISWTSTRQLGVRGFTVLFTKSTDGGATWLPTVEVPGMISGVSPAPSYSRPEIAVDIRGLNSDRVFISGRDSTSGEVNMARSDNSGASFTFLGAASGNNPVANPPPVWNADGTAVVTPGNAFIRTSEQTQPVLGPVPAGPVGGYRLVGANGAVYTFGNAGNFGSLAGIPLNRPIVGSATTPSGNGYWMVASDGGIFAFGDARFFGSTGGIPLNKPIVGMASSPSGNGYWLVASDGGIFAFGDAKFFGSTGGIPLNQPIVGMAPTPTGNGYWLVASDGGIFAFGDARFFGSTGGIPLNKPIVGMTPTASGNGYWLVASDGGIFAFGDAAFFGSTGSVPLNKPIIGMTASPTGQGYNLVASDGGIFSFGDAQFFGSTGGQPLAAPIVASSPSNKIGGIRPLYVGWIAPKSAGTCPPSCEQLGELSVDSYLVVAKSLDYGQTWTRNRAIALRGFISPAGSLFGGSHFPRLQVGINGEVYTTFNAGPTQPGSNQCGPGPFGAGAGTNNRPCPSFGPTGFKSADHFMNWDMDPWFLRSTDQGATWGNLQQLNEPKKPGLAVPEITQTRHPEMVVAPDGRIDIAWEDRRHWYLNTSDRKGAVTPGGSALGNYACVHSHSNCPEARLGDTYYTRSSDNGLSFAFNKRVNDRSHNNDVGYDYRFSTYWDYGPALVHLGSERLLVADMDARLGNVDTESQDIFLRKVELNTVSGPIPVNHLGTGTAPNLSVALSQHTYPGGNEAVHGEGFTSRPWTRPVIVNEADMPSALAGGVLARANLGPLLASPQAGLPANVQAEVDRLNPVGAFIIGDATKLSPTVEAQLAAAGVPLAQIVRIPGGTPAEIAANIALAMDRRRDIDKAPATATPLPAFDAVIVVNPNSASAASVSTLAANRRLPVLYTDQNSVPAATLSAISALNVNRVILVGSTGVISNQVVNAAARNVAGGATTAGSNTFTSTNGAFTNGDIGRGFSGTGIPAGTTITGVNSPTSVTLSNPATATNTQPCTPVAPATTCTEPTYVVGARTTGFTAAQVTRLGGADQFATSVAVVQESLARGLPRNQVYVADGNEPMHGALLGAFAGRVGGLMILTQGGTAAAAETTLTSAPLNLRPHLDRLLTSDLQGTAVVANDPPNVTP